MYDREINEITASTMRPTTHDTLTTMCIKARTQDCQGGRDGGERARKRSKNITKLGKYEHIYVLVYVQGCGGSERDGMADCNSSNQKMGHIGTLKYKPEAILKIIIIMCPLSRVRKQVAIKNMFEFEWPYEQRRCRY